MGYADRFNRGLPEGQLLPEEEGEGDGREIERDNEFAHGVFVVRCLRFFWGGSVYLLFDRPHPIEEDTLGPSGERYVPLGNERGVGKVGPDEPVVLFFG